MNFSVSPPSQSIISLFINSDGSFNVPSFATAPEVQWGGCLYYNLTDSTLYLSSEVNTWNAVSGSGTIGPALTSIANLTTSGNEIIYTIASNTYATSGISASGRSFLTYSSASQQRTGLGLEIGVNVQAYSYILNSLENITSTSDVIPYTSAGLYASAPVASWARLNLFPITSASALVSLLGTLSATSVSTANALIKATGTNAVTESGVRVDSSNNMSGINDLSAGGNMTLTGNLDNLTPFIRTQLANIGTDTIGAPAWDYLSTLNQDVSTTSSPVFAGANMNSSKITNVATPTVSTDGANKSYVDSVAGAGITPLASASAATTTSLSATYDASTGTLTASPVTTTLSIDTVSITANSGQRIIVKNQDSLPENGVYQRTSDVGGAWVLTRTTDFNTAPISKGTYVLVVGGSTNLNTSWILSQNVTVFSPPPGSDVIWAQFSSSVNLTTGNGLTSSGTVWSVYPTDKFQFSGSQLDLATVSPTYGGTGLTLSGGDTNKVPVTNGTSAFTITKSAPAGDFVGTTDSQSLTTKTMTDNSNNVIARSLWAGSGSGSVSVYAATAPSSGQVLTATGSSTATWQTPATANENPTNTLFVYKTASDVSPTYSTVAGALADTLATSATSTTPCQILVYSGTFAENNPLNIPPWVTLTGIAANQGNVVIKASNADVNLINIKGNTRINGIIFDGNTGSGYATNGIYSYLGGGGGDPVSPAQDILNNVTVRNCSNYGLYVPGNGAQYSKLVIATNISVLVTVLQVMTCGIYCSAGSIFRGNIVSLSGFFIGSSAYMTTAISCSDRYTYIDVYGANITSVASGIYCGRCSTDTQTDYPIIRASDTHIDLFSTYGIYMAPKCYLRLNDVQVISDTTGIAPYTSQIALYIENPALPAAKKFLAGLWTDIRLDKIVFDGGASNNIAELRGINLSEVPNYVESLISGKLSVGLPVLPAQASMGEGSSYISSMIVFVYNATSNTSTNYTTQAAYIDASGFSMFPSPLATNHAFYVGSDFSYTGIKLGLLTAIALSSGTIGTTVAWEFWNGSAWTSLPFMITLGDSPFTNYNTQSLGVGTTLVSTTEYQYRFGVLTSWSTTLASTASIVLPVGISDVLRYYIRVRIISGGAAQISTVPVADSVRLQVNATKINGSGYLEYFGTARIKQRTYIPMSSLSSTGTAGETAPATQRLVATSWATSTIASNVPNSLFANALTTCATFTQYFPASICSANSINIILTYSRGTVGGTTGNIAWQVDYIYTTSGNTIGNPNGSATTAGVSTGVVATSAPTTTRTQGQAIIPISVLGLDPSYIVWFKITRFGNAGTDTFTGDIYLFNVCIDYLAWSNGVYNG